MLSIPNLLKDIFEYFYYFLVCQNLMSYPPITSGYSSDQIFLGYWKISRILNLDIRQNILIKNHLDDAVMVPMDHQTSFSTRDHLKVLIKISPLDDFSSRIISKFSGVLYLFVFKRYSQWRFFTANLGTAAWSKESKILILIRNVVLLIQKIVHVLVHVGVWAVYVCVYVCLWVCVCVAVCLW